MTGLIDIDFDLSDIRRRCADANAVLRNGVRGAVMTAAREGLETAKARRRYKDRTGDLTRKAYAARNMGGASDANAVIVWPMKYASFVDSGTSRMKAYAFAGDAYIKAEAVLTRECELVVARAEAIFNR